MASVCYGKLQQLNLLLLLLLLLLQTRFWSEVYDGAKLFYLSGMQHGKYLKREVRGGGG
jgi:hypothetical protein